MGACPGRIENEPIIPDVYKRQSLINGQCGNRVHVAAELGERFQFTILCLVDLQCSRHFLHGLNPVSYTHLQFKEPSIGLQLATELGTIALLTNIFREMMALLGTPIIKKYFGKLAPISAAGVNSMDVLLPSITRYSGKEMIPIAILHGILIDIIVPVFVSFFCNL